MFSTSESRILITRSILKYIYLVRVDHSRVKAVGPDRAAAEWVLRLGGSVKFVDFKNWSTDYNLLPSGSVQLRLEAINNSGIAVTSNGLEHLGTD